MKKIYVFIIAVFCIMLGFLIHDTIKYNRENAVEVDTVYADTTVVVDSTMTIENGKLIADTICNE